MQRVGESPLRQRRIGYTVTWPGRNMCKRIRKEFVPAGPTSDQSTCGDYKEAPGNSAVHQGVCKQGGLREAMRPRRLHSNQGNRLTMQTHRLARLLAFLEPTMHFPHGTSVAHRQI